MTEPAEQIKLPALIDSGPFGESRLSQRERQLLSALSRVRELEKDVDEARSGCVAWESAISGVEAHIMDRIAMKDTSQPQIYLEILQYDVAAVRGDTEAIRKATWHRENCYRERADRAEDECDRLQSSHAEIVAKIGECEIGNGGMGYGELLVWIGKKLQP